MDTVIEVERNSHSHWCPEASWRVFANLHLFWVFRGGQW